MKMHIIGGKTYVEVEKDAKVSFPDNIVELTANDIRWQPDKVIDLLANLARRVSSLEYQLINAQGNIERQGVEIAEAAKTADTALRKAISVDDRDDITIDRVIALEDRLESYEADIRLLDERTQVVNAIQTYYGGAR